MTSGWARTKRSRLRGETAAVLRPAPAFNAAKEARMPAPGFSSGTGDDQRMAEGALVSRRRAPREQGPEIGRLGQADVVFPVVFQVSGNADVHDADLAAGGAAVGVEVGPLQAVQGNRDPGLEMEAGSGREALAQARGDVDRGHGNARGVDRGDGRGEQPGAQGLRTGRCRKCRRPGKSRWRRRRPGSFSSGTAPAMTSMAQPRSRRSS